MVFFRQKIDIPLAVWDTLLWDERVGIFEDRWFRSKGFDEREAASQVFGTLSLNLMRGNALMLATRAPDVDIPRTEVDGVE